MATFTAYHIAASGGTYRAFPLSEADFTNWATLKVTMTEAGATGKYSGTLDDTYGNDWAIFASDSTPTSFSAAVGLVDLGGSVTNVDLTDISAEIAKIPRAASALTPGGNITRSKQSATSDTLVERLS